MALEAEFKHGDAVLMVPYTPSGAAVVAGQVVVVNQVPYVAHVRIEDGQLGALAARNGSYECIADGNLVAGVKVYWNDTTNKVTVTAAAGANKHFGFLEPQSDPAADGDACRVVHAPDGSSV